MTELASDFIVSTCQLLPKPFTPFGNHKRDFLSTWDIGPEAYKFICGSHAEFYIRPLNPCIDDVDILLARCDMLAFSGEHLVLPSDPSGLSDTIKCYKIETYNRYPGFIRLRLWGEMNYN